MRRSPGFLHRRACTEAAATLAARFAAHRVPYPPVESIRMRIRVGRWAIQSMLALAAASASGQPRPSARRPASARPARRRRRAAARAAGVALGAQGLRAGALAAGADPHRASRAAPARPRSARASSSPRTATSSPTSTSSARRRSSPSATTSSTSPPTAARRRCRSCSSTCCTTWRCSRPRDSPGRKTFDALPLSPRAQPLSQGERIYSLGNPLDVGFAVVQGTYNGLVEAAASIRRSFGGALIGGMSGGPALDEEGHVIGINVARRVDGEQVSFLVPATVRDRAPGARPRRGADHRARPTHDRRRAAAWQHQARAHRALPAAGLEERDPSALPACRCRPTCSCAAGARASRRAPAAWTSSALIA